MGFNLKLDSTHDIIIGRGTTRTGQFVAQLVKCRLLTVLGEWEQDRSLGVPWINKVFIRGNSLGIVHNYVYDVIIRTNGVAAVTRLVLTPDYKKRILTIEFTGVAEEGQFTGEIEYGGS